LEGFEFSISEETLRAIKDMGYEKPTPIQEMTIAPLLDGRDIIGQAQTGTGKTAAFGIPLVEKIDPSQRYVQAIVLSPTRELAVQTAGEINKLGRYHTGLLCTAVYGGAPYEKQLRELKLGAQIVVGTPGRVMDHMRRGSLDISRITMCVLDEADEMLDMGFRDDIESILSQSNENHQTALFSATMPLPILSLAQKYIKNPETMKVENRALTVEAVKQTCIQVRSFHKNELLARLLVRDNIGKALVFMNTKLGVEDVVTNLQTRGFAAAGLHGDMRQIERDAIMARFKGGMVDILVATDVAARGLDIQNVEAVFNYDIPLDVENYVHRIGRTGRAGKEGRAYTFVVGTEMRRVWDYRRITKAVILVEFPPSGEDIRKAEDARFMAGTLSLSESEELNTDAAKQLLEGHEPEKIVAALLKQLEDLQGSKIHPELDIRIPEPPKPAPRPKPAYARPVQGDGKRPFGVARDGGKGRSQGGDRPAREQGGKKPFGKKPYDKPFDGEKPRFGKKPEHKDAARGPREPFDPRKHIPHAPKRTGEVRGHQKKQGGEG